MISTYRKSYFTLNECDGIKESCLGGYWRLLFNFFGVWLLLLTLFANFLFHMHLHLETKKRQLQYNQFCRHTSDTGLTSARI